MGRDHNVARLNTRTPGSLRHAVRLETSWPGQWLCYLAAVVSICEYTVSNKGGLPCHCHDCGQSYFVGTTAPTAPGSAAYANVQSSSQKLGKFSQRPIYHQQLQQISYSLRQVIASLKSPLNGYYISSSYTSRLTYKGKMHSPKFGTILYRTGGDLLTSLSWALGSPKVPATEHLEYIDGGLDINTAHIILPLSTYPQTLFAHCRFCKAMMFIPIFNNRVLTELYSNRTKSTVPLTNAGVGAAVW